jgi:hypothetical protein
MLKNLGEKCTKSNISNQILNDKQMNSLMKSLSNPELVQLIALNIKGPTEPAKGQIMVLLPYLILIINSIFSIRQTTISSIICG